ncbi:MAG: arsenate reductase ArsC [Candidatus Hadarchaeum sp.]|uniref:arsenate reductase ArsC n=1 Tax=Candidatus Hadarchaeum sp. TaxID=2883567 RepID=UPI00317066DA
MKKVLFVCVENSARSQMAEAFFNKMAKSARAESAGTKPAAAVNPMAVEVMREVGIDISAAKPKMITREMLEAADRVRTMGCISGELCPATLVPTEDWGIEDPAGKSIEKFREIRELIRIRVEKLVEEMER